MKKLDFLMLILAVSIAFTANSQTLIHYWNFNNSSNQSTLLAPSSSILNGASIITSKAIEVSSITGQDFASINAQNNDEAASHLRYNSPIGESIIISVPSTGFSNCVLKYVTRRSSNSAAQIQKISYSLNGSSYTFLTNLIINETPSLKELNFDTINLSDNNANFKIKIEFELGTATGNGGNNRIDNLTFEGTTIGPDLIAPLVNITPLNNANYIATNTSIVLAFNEAVRRIDNSPITAANANELLELHLENSTGAVVPFTAIFRNDSLIIQPNNLLANNANYFIQVKANTIEDLNDNVLVEKTSVFTTSPLQTVFNPGDLALVAYRMNASNADDEFAFVSFVNILPGTRLTFTDAKFTTNTPAQCAGGLVWTAPAAGIQAGTVINIKNDVPSASLGSLIGAGFGLSSGGDQVIVYAGDNDSPSYITALSSNLWLATNTSCSGSSSQLPTSLSDGFNAINLSTSPGNTNNNTVNAYYNGITTGSLASIKAAVFTASNWVGVGSGTLAQPWPNYGFPGNPRVVSASLTNSNTLELVFNNALNAGTVENRSNYTGINGLLTASLSATNTIRLVFQTPFVLNQNYSLQVQNIMDSENRALNAPYIYNFSYSPKISFANKFLVANENDGKVKVKLNIDIPSNGSVRVSLRPASYNTINNQDIAFVDSTFTLTTNDKSIEFTVPIVNDQLAEQTEYFVVYVSSATGFAVSGSNNLTVFILDNDFTAPVANKELELKHVASYNPAPETGSTAEIVAYDEQSKRLFISSSIQHKIEIVDFSNPQQISKVGTINMAIYGGNTSVAIKNGIVAVASPNDDETQNGKIIFFNTSGKYLNQVTVGALPDMVCFSPNGQLVLSANEGQPNLSGSIDPEGSVSIVDITIGVSRLTQSNVTTLGFGGFNEADLLAKGIRKPNKNKTLAQEMEPEYIAISENGTKAWVALQENNAVAEIDLTTKSFTNIWGLGTKDYSKPGNGFDASDKSGEILIANWPVKGYYMPDGIATYTVNGTNYLVTANEGDEKEYGDFNERTTVGAVNLDPTKFPNASWLKEEQNLGRFRITNANGDTDNDGDFDELYAVGARSFSIFNTSTKQLVFDSGDQLEQITAVSEKSAGNFNADNEANGEKSRSRAKGPEPEGVTIAKIKGENYAFIGLERVGGVMVYNISNPNAPYFVDYNNTRNLSGYYGDHGPEGLIYISEEHSPNQKAYLLVANEISGTLSIFEVINNRSVGVNEADANSTEFTCYPNPIKRNETLKFNQVSNIQVLDAQGNLVFEKENISELSTSNWTAGIYFVKNDLGAIQKVIVH